MWKHFPCNLFVFMLLFVAVWTQGLNFINTIPPTPGNVLATGYPRFIVTAQTQYYYNGFSSRVDWQYGASLQYSHRVITYYDSCNPLQNSDFIITCTQGSGVGTVSTNLTLVRPLSEVTLQAQLYDAYYGTRLVLPIKTIRDCRSDVGNYVTVQASSYTYASNGSFECSNGGKVFFSNGTLLQSTNTTCLFNAEWNQEDDVRCWTDPSVEVVGNATLYEGDDLHITCLRNQQQNPSRGTYLYYLGNDVIGSSSLNTFVYSNIQPRHNNVFLSCWVLNPYTRIYRNTGRSNPQLITVYYHPFQATSEKTVCRWVEGESHRCSIKFKSNPASEQVVLEKAGLGIVRTNHAQPSLYAVGDLQTYVYQKNKVTLEDNGTYTLTVISKSFNNQTLSIVFDIIVNNSEAIQDTPLQDTTTMSLSTVALALAAAATIVLIAIVTAYYCGRKSGLHKTSTTTGENTETGVTSQNTMSQSSSTNTRYAQLTLPGANVSNQKWGQTYGDQAVKYDAQKETIDTHYVNFALAPLQSNETACSNPMDVALRNPQTRQVPVQCKTYT